MSQLANDSLEQPWQPAESPEWSRWASLVQRIEDGSAEAEGELFNVLIARLRFYFLRQTRAGESEDLAHETLLIVLQAVRKKKLREPGRLMGFVRVVAHRTLCAAIKSAQRNRLDGRQELADSVIAGNCNPESAALKKERVTMVREGLQALPELDRSILTRFYLCQQSPETICRELHLTQNQFRLKKSRAKAQLSILAQRIQGRRRFRNFLSVRTPNVSHTTRDAAVAR